MRKIHVVALSLFLAVPLGADTFIYKSSNKIDYLKIDQAKKVEKEGGLKHPHSFSPDKIREILRSIRFNRKAIIFADIREDQLFPERNVEFLAPYLIEAFNKVEPEQVVVISFFTERSDNVLPDDRLTIFRAYLKEDGLHLKFSKLYAKLLGDRTTKGATRAVQAAKGLRVSLELQPGQNRVSWDPEEIVIDPDFKPGKAAPVPEKKVDVRMKPSQTADHRPVRDRLKELDRLKEEELITEKEYQKKRQQLLREL